MLNMFNELDAQILVGACSGTTKMLAKTTLAPPDLLLMVTVSPLKISLGLPHILSTASPACCQIDNKRRATCHVLPDGVGFLCVVALKHF